LAKKNSFKEKEIITFIKTNLFNGSNNIIEHESIDEICVTAEEHFLTSSYEKVVNIFGQFKQESIALWLSELR